MRLTITIEDTQGDQLAYEIERRVRTQAGAEAKAEVGMPVAAMPDIAPSAPRKRAKGGRRK